MNKRGQIVVFLIIALLILGSYLLFSFLQAKATVRQVKQEDTSFDITSVKSAVETCMHATLLEALVVIGQQGGFYRKPTVELWEDNSSFLPYYAVDGMQAIPALATIENQINLYVDDHLETCTQRAFQQFTYFSFTTNIPAATASITDADVILSVKYPVVIKNGEVTRTLETLQVREDDIRIKNIYDFVVDSKDAFGASEICTSCVEKNAEVHDLHGIFKEVPTNSFIVSITDLNSRFKDEPYEYVFALRLQGDQHE